MKKMLVSDYDQTFYVNDIDIEKNKKWVDNFREKNNIFVIATGRSYIDFKEVLTKYHFSYDYAILNHGMTIIDKDGNVLINYSIDKSMISKIIGDLKMANKIIYFYDDFKESTKYYENKKVVKINIKYNSKDIALKVSKQLNLKYGKYINAYCVPLNDVEIIIKTTNKAYAIIFIANREKILKSNIYTIGDGYNDIEMIKNFNGYCMKESTIELKKNALDEVASVSELIGKII